MFETPEWQTYRRKKSLHGPFLTGPALKDYWLKEREKHYRWMVAMDAMKGVPTPLILGLGQADEAGGR